MKAKAVSLAPTSMNPSVDDEAKKLEERMRAESGPVRTTLDLNNFVVFEHEFRGSRGKWCKVNNRGEIRISDGVGREITTSRIEIRANKVGTILVIKAVEKGGLMTRRTNGHNSKALTTTCKAVATYLEKCGIELPARYELEWDTGLGVWVGRIIK